ncbi:MAG: DUF3240 family protein [Methylophilaceae bacterium]|nr:DUF3240 family protein [Methylophilaceae bacterium]
MSKHVDVCLNMILPMALKDQVLDLLLKHPDWVGPFTTHRVESHGDPDEVASIAEQVRGRTERVRIEILMNRAHVEALLARLRAELTSPDSVWWLTPILSAGSLT